MSVIHFDAHELGNLARVIVNSMPDYINAKTALKSLATDLHTISRANSKCYEFRYGEKTPPVKMGPIIVAAEKAPGDLAKAVRTAGAIHYNCRENVDYLDEQPGGMKALMLVMSALMDLQETKLEVQQKKLNALLGANLQLENQTF